MGTESERKGGKSFVVMEVTIDASVFEGMPPPLVEKLIGLWKTNVQECMGKLRAAVEAKDEKEIRVHLHTLKGVSAQVGASTVSETALTMEKAKKWCPM